ncbi:MAG: hypothetical protein JJT81_16780 [Rubellimicrobium sp.]|nr:hypothetical protein [Rubellimicrobium sp.]
MPNPATTRYLVTGDVTARHFPGWIRAHAAKLGLELHRLDLSDRGLELEGSGPPEMLEALALACSLGPAGVLVDRVIRAPGAQVGG